MTPPKRRAAPATPAPVKAAAPLKPAGLTRAAVELLMLRKLEGSALTAAHARRLGLIPSTAVEMGSYGLPAAGAFVIPYFSMEGRPTSFYRARYVEDTRRGFDALTGKKALRYIQPGNSVTEVYLPPLIDWREVAAAEYPILITEGELKAACATAHGLPTVGLGGVWSFQSSKHNTPLLPIFKALGLDGREVFIVFDSDAVTNPNVVAAELRLAQRLTEAGAIVKIARLPSLEDTQKVGLDDYIMLRGVEALKTVLLQAFEYDASKVLHALNQRVLYVRDPGFVWDHDLSMRLSPGAFKEHAYSNVLYDQRRVSKSGESTVRVPAAPAWLAWEHRAEVRGLVFAPGDERITDGGLLNTWAGWGCTSGPIAGDVGPWHALMQHLFGADPEGLSARLYFERWCAAPLQRPGLKMAVAAAIWGTTHGSGKTLVGHTLMRVYGAKHSAELKDTDLDDDRNEWADSKQFVLADDITARGDRKFMRRLMTMITQKWIRLNPKFVPSYSIADTINYYFTSNDPDALYMDDGDRRFFIWEVMGGKYGPYQAYVRWRDSEEGIAALWHYLLALDLGDFDPQAPAPDTAGKRSMIQLGKSDLGSWVRELKDNTASILNRAGLRGDLFNAKELHALYDPNGDKKTTVNALARELKRAGFHPPATGSSLRLPDGSMTAVYALLRGGYWAAASWKDACDHYISHRPKALWESPTAGKAKKF